MALDVESCFHALGGRVYRWAFGLCGNHADAADVTQEAFLRLTRSRPALGGEADARRWLRTVVTRIVIDRWRVRSEAPLPLSERVAAGELRDELEQSERRSAVVAALHELSERQRLVLVAKCYERLTFQEIAAELGVSVPTVKTHYLRGLDALRRRLAAPAALRSG